MNSVHSARFFAMLFCTLIGWSVSAPVFAQACDPAVAHPLPGSFGYQPRKGDERCEGLFTEQVSGQSLDILGLTKGVMQYFMDEEEILTISSTSKAPVHIRGVSTGMSSSYRLDMVLASGTSKKVPLREVLLPSQINQRHLGIFGFLATNNKPVWYVPCAVASARFGNRIKENAVYFLTVVANIDIEKAQWRIATYSGISCGNFSSPVSLQGDAFPAKTPIEIRLPDLAANRYCIELRYEISDRSFVKVFNLEIP